MTIKEALEHSIELMQHQLDNLPEYQEKTPVEDFYIAFSEDLYLFLKPGPITDEKRKDILNKYIFVYKTMPVMEEKKKDDGHNNGVTKLF